MARAFTTFFSFNGRTYTAVISHLDGTVNVYIPDTSLHDILPNGKGVYHPADGLKINKLNLSPAQRLIFKVLASIEGQIEPVIEAK